MKRGFCLLGTLGVFGLCVLVPAVAFAARFATVDDDEATIQKGPGRKFGSEGTVKRGTRIHASNYPTEGYYKIRTPSGVIGWVKADSLSLEPIPSAAPDRGTGSGANASANASSSSSSRSSSRSSSDRDDQSGGSFQQGASSDKNETNEELPPP